MKSAPLNPGEQTLRPTIGYWAAQEQYSPSQLLEHAVAADGVGFDTVFTSDHFMPWFDSGAQAGFAWTWMAAGAAVTKNLSFGTGVTAPDRYHPAIIAQAFATLDEMFPGRIFLGLGAGEAMNSKPLGVILPTASQRVTRLKDSLEIITGLWKGDFEDFSGFFYQIHGARLYTKPKRKIPLLVAAGGKKTAELAGKYADGVIGFSGGGDVLQVALDSARKHGKDPANFRRLLEFKCSYDPDYDKAVDSVRVWRSTMVNGILATDTSDPRKLEAVGSKQVSDAKMQEVWSIVTDVEELIKPIEASLKRGYDMIQVHSSSPDELGFVKEFGEKALPYLANEIRKDSQETGASTEGRPGGSPPAGNQGVSGRGR